MPKVASARAVRSSITGKVPPAQHHNKKETSSKSKPRNPKDSHLYTDDNPSTTLHGTGFKDADTARRTLHLISRRSLTYQWQVVNTMYHRAKGHPAMRKADRENDSNGAKDMKDAMAIFRKWLDETYPEAKEARKNEGREFKPLLAKGVVERYLDRIKSLETMAEEGEGEGEGGDDKDDGIDDCKRFAEIYAGLSKGKRLANVLVDDAHPEQEDWEVRRERALVALIEMRTGSGEAGLWQEKGGPSRWHLQCIGWAWSPVGERRLPP